MLRIASVEGAYSAAIGAILGARILLGKIARRSQLIFAACGAQITPVDVLGCNPPG